MTEEEMHALAGAVLVEAANVDWARGVDIKDTAPDFLSEWQRGLVAGTAAFRDAILSIRPDAHAALARALQKAREVKPLVWKEGSLRGYWSSLSVTGLYVIRDYGDEEIWVERDGETVGKWCETLEAAKAAAQADYAARIHAALQPGDGQ